MNDPIALAILKLQVRSGRTVQATVRGVSMEPTFHDGDIVSVVPTDSFKAGDVAAFHYGHEGLLVHRILSIGEGYVHLKGDNAVRVEIIPVDSLMGIVKENEGFTPASSDASSDVSSEFDSK